MTLQARHKCQLLPRIQSARCTFLHQLDCTKLRVNSSRGSFACTRHCSTIHEWTKQNQARNIFRMQLVIYSLSLLTILAFIAHFASADPLITVCNTSQYKRVVEDTCSSIYKRTKHPISHFKTHHILHLEKHRSRHYFSKKSGSTSTSSTSSSSSSKHSHPHEHRPSGLLAHFQPIFTGRHRHHGHLHHLQPRPHHPSARHHTRPRRKSQLSSPLPPRNLFAHLFPPGAAGFSDLPSHCCEVGCPHSLYVTHCDL